MLFDKHGKSSSQFQVALQASFCFGRDERSVERGDRGSAANDDLV